MIPILFLIAPIRSEPLHPGVNCTIWSQIFSAMIPQYL